MFVQSNQLHTTYFLSTEYNVEVGNQYLQLLKAKAFAQKDSVAEVLIAINTVEINNKFLSTVFNKIVGVREADINKIIPEIKPNKRPKNIIYHNHKPTLLPML